MHRADRAGGSVLTGHLRHRVTDGFRRELARFCLSLSGRSESLAKKLSSSRAAYPSHPQNARFKDLHAGRRAFVIGNGPSLAKQDLGILKGELLFTMNAFDRHPLCAVLQPVYLFLAYPDAFDNQPAHESFLVRIAEGISRESKVFVPAWAQLESVTLKRWQAAGQLCSVPLVGNMADGPVTAVDMCIGLPGVQNVAQFALMTAMYMGCNPIYLVGLDSNFAEINNVDTHFYDEPTFDESRDCTERDECGTYERTLEATLIMFRGYRHLWDFCRRKQIRVYNCTAGGCLDVFPRRHLEQVVGAR